jgi:hypothetical protein
MSGYKHPEHQLVIVFKNNITEEQAIEKVTSWNVEFKQGMDSSRGKIYFYATGEKFILTFNNDDELTAFKMNRYQFLPEIHEIYTPDWDKQKD